jgi:hypothetical protein
MSRIVIAILICLGLAACVAPQQRRPIGRLTDEKLADMSQKAKDGETARKLKDGVRRMLNGRTRVVGGGGHGVQVVYTTGNGRSYLWYPGNQTVLAGRWRIVEQMATVRTATNAYEFPQTKVCFDYGNNSYNPVTGKTGEECQHAAFMMMFSGRSVAGDKFGLSRRKAVPFVLKPTDTIDLGTGAAGGR